MAPGEEETSVGVAQQVEVSLEVVVHAAVEPLVEGVQEEVEEVAVASMGEALVALQVVAPEVAWKAEA